MAAMPTPPAALARGEIDSYRRERPVSPVAYRFLRNLRERHRGDLLNNFFLLDLTDSSEFHWRAWVSQRPDAEDIVGPGIYRFAFVWVSVKDTHQSFGRRGDFLVSRVDVDIRLHPLRDKSRTTLSREATPVWGSWADQWWPHVSRWPQDMASGKHGARVASQGQGAASQGQAPHPQSRPRARRISAVDVVTKDEAMRFLEQEWAAWKAQPHPRSAFRVDITSGVSASSQGQFNWPFFVLPREWYKQHFEGFTIAVFEAVWSDRRGKALFFGRRCDGRKFTVNPWCSHQTLEFSWGWNFDPKG